MRNMENRENTKSMRNLESRENTKSMRNVESLENTKSMRDMDSEALIERAENAKHAENMVRIYTACTDSLKNPVLYQQVMDLLPPARRAAADRMKVDSGKRLSAGAGLLLMAALADYIRGDMGSFAAFQKISFETREEGKPFLVEYPDVHFNLSHSGNRVMCAVGPVEVGCDVEIINPSHVKSVIRCFAESEQILASRSDKNFFRLWTLKESIIKLSGKGLVIPLRSFEVSLDPLSVRQDFLPEPVMLREYEVPEEEARKESREVPEEEARKESREVPEEETREKTTEMSKGRDRYCASCAVIGAGLPLQMIQADLEKIAAGNI